mmetsp:Transcript_73289/g.107605  ORF Transcript_73289/g.107605 Transcript_73289/m.107605 type:complete len:207 (+) Transcript_73289:392-1012(+)
MSAVMAASFSSSTSTCDVSSRASIKASVASPSSPCSRYTISIGKNPPARAAAAASNPAAGSHTCSYTRWMGKWRLMIFPRTITSMPFSSSMSPAISRSMQILRLTSRMVRPISLDVYGFLVSAPLMYSSCVADFVRINKYTGRVLTGHIIELNCSRRKTAVRPCRCFSRASTQAMQKRRLSCSDSEEIDANVARSSLAQSSMSFVF